MTSGNNFSHHITASDLTENNLVERLLYINCTILLTVEKLAEEVIYRLTKPLNWNNRE